LEKKTQQEKTKQRAILRFGEINLENNFLTLDFGKLKRRVIYSKN
jgi:hypothetical protein